MKNINLTPFPPIPDFSGYDTGRVSEKVERYKAIHNDAEECLKILAQNIMFYVEYVNNVMFMVLEHIIKSRQSAHYDVVDEIYEDLLEQFEELYHRYDTVQDNGHTDSYILCSLLNASSYYNLGIYNDDRITYKASFVREQAIYILDNDEKEEEERSLQTLMSEIREKEKAERLSYEKEEKEKEAVVKNIHKVLTQDEDDGSRFKFVKSDKTFKDVAGLKEVKEDLIQIVDFIKRPEFYKEHGAKLPKGTLFSGPPGTGKTLLAKAVAGEADAKFIALNSTDFTASKWGEVPKMIKELFEKARKHAPCIIFIDEIDMLGLDRGADKANSLAHRESLNAFLSALDGFDQYESITVIAATNRLEDLDSALIRPGRFDNLFAVPLPHDIDEVEEVVCIYMKNKHFDESVKTREVARKMLRHSPAFIESILNEACLIAIRKNNGIIRDCDINEAYLKKTIKGHVRENQDIKHEDAKMVAVHEAGHALVAVAEGIPVTSVTIMGTTTGAGGLTLMEPQNKHYFRKSDYEKKVKVAYGGRAAEELAFGVDMVSTGASADIKHATELIKSASAYYGFNLCETQTHAPIVYKSIAQGNLEKAANKYYQASLELLKDNVVALRTIAHELMNNGTISGARVKEIYEYYQENGNDISMYM